MTDAIANSTVPHGSTDTWRDRKRYLWLIGLVVPSLAFVGFGMHELTGWGVWFWLGPIVILGIVPAIDLVAGLDRSNPPDDVIAEPGERPVLPLDHLPLPADPVRRLRRRVLPARDERRPVGRGQDRSGRLDRLHRRHRHQHRPRARPQARGQRALALQDRAGPGRLRALLHRAQPWPPRPRRDPRGPGLGPARRDVLRVLAAHRLGLAEVRVAAGEAPLRPQEAAPLPDRQRRPQRLADDRRPLGRARRLARGRRRAVPPAPGRRRLLVARGRQLHGALRDAAAEGRHRRPPALRARRPVALVELQQHRDQRAALPPAAAQRPPREPDQALPGAARLRGVAGAADGVRRDDRPRDRAAGVAPRDGPAGARPLRRRPHPRQHRARQARQDPRDDTPADCTAGRRSARRLTAGRSG